VLLLAALPGCVERKILIQSDPPGALVRMDGRTLGKTPVEVDFIWYGTHEVIVDLPGHPVIDAYPTISAPIYQWVPLDLFFEALWPGTLVDRHVLDYKLGPPRPPPDQAAVDELMRRAAVFRDRARAGTR